MLVDKAAVTTSTVVKTEIVMTTVVADAAVVLGAPTWLDLITDFRLGKSRGYIIIIIISVNHFDLIMQNLVMSFMSRNPQYSLGGCQGIFKR